MLQVLLINIPDPVVDQVTSCMADVTFLVLHGDKGYRAFCDRSHDLRVTYVGEGGSENFLPLISSFDFFGVLLTAEKCEQGIWVPKPEDLPLEIRDLIVLQNTAMTTHGLSWDGLCEAIQAKRSEPGIRTIDALYMLAGQAGINIGQLTAAA